MRKRSNELAIERLQDVSFLQCSMCDIISFFCKLNFCRINALLSWLTNTANTHVRQRHPARAVTEVETADAQMEMVTSCLLQT